MLRNFRILTFALLGGFFAIMAGLTLGDIIDDYSGPRPHVPSLYFGEVRGVESADVRVDAIMELAGLLWEHYPLDETLHLSSGYIPFDRRGDTGFCLACVPPHYTIRLDGTSSLNAMAETLAHEWAHALNWNTPGDPEDHGPEWGLFYSKTYRLYERWALGEFIEDPLQPAEPDDR